MTNYEIAKILRNVATSYVIRDENKYRFQIIAYQRAADVIDHLNENVEDIYKDRKIKKIPGLGTSIMSHLQELLKTGNVKHFTDLMKNIPPATFLLTDIPSFGPKKAYKIASIFNLKPDTAIENIKKLAQENKIAEIPGFGEKSQDDILRAIAEFEQGKTKSYRMPLPYACELAEKVVEYLKKSKDVIYVYPLGSLRRMLETIGDIDIAVSTNNYQAVINYFVKYPLAERVLEKGDTSASILVPPQRQVDLMVQKPESFGSLLQHFTGSKNHNIHLREYAQKKGLSLSEYGIKKQVAGGKGRIKNCETEEEFYRAIGLEWIPPEIREDQGEIELAQKHNLPKLVELKDIKGDLHTHSNFSIEPSHDLGSDTMKEMIEKAESLGYKYIGFSEHNPSINNHTHKQIYSILKRRKEYIEQINSSNLSVRAINLLEVDILANSHLALDDKSLELIDGAIVSVHSSFSMSKEKMTKRILEGLSNPKARILGHPTGRLINERPGYEADWNKVFEYCAKRNIAIEINSWPIRLDLRPELVREAKNFGVKFVINTDSHAKFQLDNMFYGVAVARRGFCTKENILNTLPYQNFMSWLANK